MRNQAAKVTFGFTLFTVLMAVQFSQASNYQKAEGLDLSFIPLVETDLPSRIRDSIVRIDFDVAAPSAAAGPGLHETVIQPGHCTGTYISNSRDILTAAHCLESCLFRGSSSLGRNHVGATCKLKINGEPAVVQVKHMSQCTLMSTYDKKVGRAMGIPVPQVPEICSSQNDVAIIRPISKLSRKFSCLKIQKKYTTTQRVFTVGHPGQSSRSDRRTYDSDGQQAYYSRGEIVRRSTCELRQHADKTSDLVIDGYRYNVGSKVMLPPEVGVAGAGKIQSTVDIIGGSSGSPLINSNGEIVGVASFVFEEAQGPHSECAGAAFFEPVTSVEQTVAQLRQLSSVRMPASAVAPGCE